MERPVVRMHANQDTCTFLQCHLKPWPTSDGKSTTSEMHAKTHTTHETQMTCCWQITNCVNRSYFCFQNEFVNKLIREDSPTPVKKAKANQNTTSRPSAAQNVIQQHRRLVWGKSQLFDVPKEINHQTKVCKKQQKATKIVARRLTKGRVFYAIKNGITKK